MNNKFRYVMGSDCSYFPSMEKVVEDIKQQRLYDARVGQAFAKAIIQERDWETGTWITVKTV